MTDVHLRINLEPFKIIEQKKIKTGCDHSLTAKHRYDDTIVVFDDFDQQNRAFDGRLISMYLYS